MDRRQQISYNESTPFIVANPVGIQRIIKELQLSFIDNLDWLTVSFGEAFRKYKVLEGGSTYVFPSVWTGEDQDDLELMGNDNHDAYTFSFPVGAASYDEEQLSQRVITRNLEVIFWFNMDIVNPDASNEYTENLAIEISQVINKTSFNDGDAITMLEYTTDPKEIYSEFSVSLAEDQRLMWPYRGVKFTLECVYSDTYCQPSSI